MRFEKTVNKNYRAKAGCFNTVGMCAFLAKRIFGRDEEGEARRRPSRAPCTFFETDKVAPVSKSADCDRVAYILEYRNMKHFFKATGGKKLEGFSALVLATGGFVGFFPLATGTVGSIVGVALVWILKSVSLPLYGLVTLCLGIVAWWACDRASQAFKKADPPQIVIDEIVGFVVTMIAIPVTGYWLVLGFLVFRFFDVIKPFPVSWINDRLKNGWGILLDDIMAGVFGNIVLQLALRSKM